MDTVNTTTVMITAMGIPLSTCQPLRSPAPSAMSNLATNHQLRKLNGTSTYLPCPLAIQHLQSRSIPVTLSQSTQHAAELKKRRHTHVVSHIGQNHLPDWIQTQVQRHALQLCLHQINIVVQHEARFILTDATVLKIAAPTNSELTH